MAGAKKRAGFSPWKPHYKLEKYSEGVGPDVTPDEVIEWDGNLMMNAGINVMLDLLIGAAGTDFDNTNGYLGVGNSSAAEAFTGRHSSTQASPLTSAWIASVCPGSTSAATYSGATARIRSRASAKKTRRSSAVSPST